ncbi:50S ribosomal protein L14e [Candidatus Woesearchaeota archaeon]|nr:50S ribosomal protein L14e [Candidatus Woesearchaeota archaeon]
MIEIGRVCVKIAGRDAGKKCVIIDILDEKNVLIDGETRRKKCNIAHLEMLPQTLEVTKGASHETVCNALGIKARVAKVRTTPKTQKAPAKKPAEKTTAAAKK